MYMYNAHDVDIGEIITMKTDDVNSNVNVVICQRYRFNRLDMN